VNVTGTVWCSEQGSPSFGGVIQPGVLAAPELVTVTCPNGRAQLMPAPTVTSLTVVSVCELVNVYGGWHRGGLSGANPLKSALAATGSNAKTTNGIGPKRWTRCHMFVEATPLSS
jgi:hypothetical protein